MLGGLRPNTTSADSTDVLLLTTRSLTIKSNHSKSLSSDLWKHLLVFPETFSSCQLTAAWKQHVHTASEEQGECLPNGVTHRCAAGAALCHPKTPTSSLLFRHTVQLSQWPATIKKRGIYDNYIFLIVFLLCNKKGQTNSVMNLHVHSCCK